MLFGATGFTGGLTADYLAAHAPGDLRWALAGRNPTKLAAVRDRLAAGNPRCAGLDLLTVDSADAQRLREVAGSARVVASTVGPYQRQGEPLVAACAGAGTDYLDLAGEPRFVDEMYLRHHETAVRTGARLVHACGFDSIPADLGAYFTVHQLPEGVPLKVEGFVRGRGRASAGTVHSVLGIVADLPASQRAQRERRAKEPRLNDRRARVTGPLPATHPRRGWALSLPTLDPLVVTRSAAALDRYGPDFQYGQYLSVRRLAAAAGLVVGAGALVAAAQLRPVRERILSRWPSGTGPDADQRRDGWFSVEFTGVGGGQRVLTEVHGDQDPGYGSTAVMFAESALCLASDPLPTTAGQVTTAVAMGNALIARLDRAGITFRVRRHWP